MEIPGVRWGWKTKMKSGLSTAIKEMWTHQKSARLSKKVLLPLLRKDISSGVIDTFYGKKLFFSKLDIFNGKKKSNFLTKSIFSS